MHRLLCLVHSDQEIIQIKIRLKKKSPNRKNARLLTKIWMNELEVRKN